MQKVSGIYLSFSAKYRKACDWSLTMATIHIITARQAHLMWIYRSANCEQYARQTLPSKLPALSDDGEV